MKLYNTLTRKVEDFKPIKDGQVKLFVCGPTVYDLAQIGNAKTYIQLDVLTRVLRASGFDVFYLQNITDIDDKIIARAKEQGISWEDLRDKYEVEYKKDMETLGNTAVSQYARATDYIDDIIRQVQTLMDIGNAYKIYDGIYFEVATFADYGKLSGRQEVQKDDAQTRIDHSDEKRGWNDFCLWKFSKPGEPVWDAPFGKGRPGWHIEDTAITEQFFGSQYDIHGGAIDLIFPHHEAEITQMESISGKVPFVRYWVHGGFLTVNGKRMGKSLGNFFTIREVLGKYDPTAIRLFMLQTHYRSAINFTWEDLDAAKNRLGRWKTTADLRWQPQESTITDEVTIQAEIARIDLDILRALQDDLGTPQALAKIDDFFGAVEIKLLRPNEITQFTQLLEHICDRLGIDLLDSQDITNAQKQIIAERDKDRGLKNWAKSDELRKKLEEQGIGLRDTPYGAIWYRL